MRAALVNCGFEFPLRRITVNLAPADLRKAGPGFDLALAAALLAASGQLPAERARGYAIARRARPRRHARPVRGRARDGGRLPARGPARADRAGGERGGGVAGRRASRWCRSSALARPRARCSRARPRRSRSRSTRGAARARAARRRRPRPGARPHGLKRALAIAAAGGHNLLMVGPPGSGKSMAARRLPSIMPPLTLSEALEVTRVHSAAGLLRGEPLVARRPFRAPHHTISSAGLVGGGSVPAPGEVSLAHHGVLFLDELAEFSRPALEALRQPLEEGCIRITRAQRAVTFPARFMLVGGDAIRARAGTPATRAGHARCIRPPVHRYSAKLSGPLLDRIDMIVRVDPPSRDEVMSDAPSEGPPRSARAWSPPVRARPSGSPGTGARCNAELDAAEARALCRLDAAPPARPSRGPRAARLSVRGHDRVLRVARTIADLDGREAIERRTSRRRSPTASTRPSELLAAAVLSACDACLRRSALLGALVALDRPGARRAPPAPRAACAGGRRAARGGLRAQKARRAGRRRPEASTVAGGEAGARAGLETACRHEAG